MREFDEDAYRDRQLNEYLDGLDINAEEAYDEWENAMCDKADAQKELDREQDGEE